MKTWLPILLFFTTMQLGHAQLVTPQNEAPHSKKNSLSLIYNSDLGVGIRYNRTLFEKGNYKLLGQVGLHGRYLGKFGDENIVQFQAPISISQSFTIKQHSFEMGAGVQISRHDWPDQILDRGYPNWSTNAFLHFGYKFQPKGKNWFLEANYDPTFYGRHNVSHNLSFGIGIRF